MLAWDENDDAEKISLQVTGDMTVQHTGELHRKLLEFLERGKDVELKLGEIENADITFLQLLCSAHRTYLSKDKMLTVTGKRNELLEMKKLSGFVRHKGCSRDKFTNCILVKEKS